MIVKRLEKNGKIKAMYSSSTICVSIYDTTNKELTVIFNNGGQYKYPNVAASDYMRLETADSNGTIFNNYIKKNYTNFEKLDKLPESALVSIIKEIEELKPAEKTVSIEDTTKLMMESIINVLSNYISSGNVNDDLVSVLQTKINDYQKLK